jgi:hypothetical protein
LVGLLLPSAFKLLQGRANVRLVHDRVSPEDVGSLPSGYPHDDFLRNTGGAQIPCRCPAQVVEEKCGHAGVKTDSCETKPPASVGLSVEPDSWVKQQAPTDSFVHTDRHPWEFAHDSAESY